jgi:hypothetical protein
MRRFAQSGLTFDCPSLAEPGQQNLANVPAPARLHQPVGYSTTGPIDILPRQHKSAANQECLRSIRLLEQNHLF